MNIVKGILGKGDQKGDANAHGDANVDGAAGPEGAAGVAVGLPQAGTKQAEVSYTDTQISDKQRAMPTDSVKESVERGQDVEMTTETVKTARTEMVKETVDVPTTEMVTETVSKPVTRTKEVTETVRDVEMRQEAVEREEVVLDKETVTQPTTVMKPIKTEAPELIKSKKAVPQLHEEMRTLTVVRPRTEMRKVTVKRPVDVQRTVTGKKPVQVKKVVKTEAPERKVEQVNITQPALSSYEAEVQVAYDEKKHVEYEKPVTVIRGADKKQVTRDEAEAADVEGKERKEEDKAIKKGNRGRDWNAIPVGLPFTELVAKSKNFTETKLKSETQSVRETKMEPKQVEKVTYVMKPTEVELTTWELQDYEETITVSELQEVTEEVEVTVMEEVEEEWPVAKETTAEVWTAAVSLEPVTTEVPELAMEDVEVEKPRTVVKTETIEKAVPVEREVTTQKTYTENVDVEVQRPQETTKQVEVEKPKTVYDETEVSVPTSVGKDVGVSSVAAGEKTVTEQEATSQSKSKSYTTVDGKMAATAVHPDVRLEEDVNTADVSDKELAAAKRRQVAGAPGVVAHAVVGDDHVNEKREASGAIAGDPREVAPDAMLADGVAKVTITEGGAPGDVGVDGRLVTKDETADAINAMQEGGEDRQIAMEKVKDKLPSTSAEVDV